MTLYEVGIFNNSSLVYSESFYPIEGNKHQNTHRRSHVAKLLSRMSEKIYQKGANHIKAGKFQVFISAANKEDNCNYFIYTVGNQKSDTAVMNELLESLLQKIQKISGKNKFFGCAAISKEEKQVMSQIVHKTLADERLKPSDRVLRYVFS